MRAIAARRHCGLAPSVVGVVWLRGTVVVGVVRLRGTVVGVVRLSYAGAARLVATVHCAGAGAVAGQRH